MKDSIDSLQIEENRRKRNNKNQPNKLYNYSKT